MRNSRSIARNFNAVMVIPYRPLDFGFFLSTILPVENKKEEQICYVKSENLLSVTLGFCC